LCAVFVVILLTSCATTYQKQGFTGGFSETQLGENIFQISFKGTRPQRGMSRLFITATLFPK
jgi:hypothetical protein